MPRSLFIGMTALHGYQQGVRAFANNTRNPNTPVRSDVVKLSSWDLSQAFSDLVNMQRAYQASPQVVSTANDMLQELFAMKDK